MANQGSEARGLVRANERLLPLTEGELESVQVKGV